MKIEENGDTEREEEERKKRHLSKGKKGEREGGLIFLT